MKPKLEQTDIFSSENIEETVAPQPQAESVESTTPVTKEEMELRAKNRARKDEEVPVMPEPKKEVAPPPPPAKPLTAIQLFNNSLEAYKKQVLPNLLSKHNIEPAQFVQIVVSELKKNPKLLDAFKENPSSLFASILAGAEIGLIPSDMLGEFYLIPRRIDGKQTVTP